MFADGDADLPDIEEEADEEGQQEVAGAGMDTQEEHGQDVGRVAAGSVGGDDGGDGRGQDNAHDKNDPGCGDVIDVEEKQPR